MIMTLSSCLSVYVMNISREKIKMMNKGLLFIIIVIYRLFYFKKINGNNPAMSNNEQHPIKYLQLK